MSICMRYIFIALLLLGSLRLSAQEHPKYTTYAEAEKEMLTHFWNYTTGVAGTDKPDAHFSTKPDYERTRVFLVKILESVITQQHKKTSDIHWYTIVADNTIQIIYYYDNGNPAQRDIVGIIKAKFSAEIGIMMLCKVKLTPAAKVKDKKDLLSRI